MKNLIIAAAFSIAAISCKTQQPAATVPTNVNAPVSNAAFFSAVQKKSQFQQVKINSKIDAETGAFVPTIDAAIYIENSKKVWMNMSVLFANVARGIATPEGIKGYEKWNKTYIESDFSYLNNLLNVNFINYDALQNLLVGKTFIPVNEKDFVLTKNAQGYTLTSAKNQKVTVNGSTSEYLVKMNYDENFDLQDVLLKDATTADNLEVQYSNWTDVGSERFPRNVKIIIKGQKNGQILLENTKFDFAKMETPYSVPSNYTKKTIK